MSTPDTPAPTPVVEDRQAFDAAARGILSLALVSALLWLVLGGSLMLIHTVQLHSPRFFSTCEWFTFGRLQAAAETALLYGWVGNAGFAIALWLLGRLGGAAPRSRSLATMGTVFWNLGVTAALVAILSGDQTGHASVQIPGYVLPLLILASAAMGTTGILAWADRNKEATYATQWYAAAALFVLPWLLSASLVFLYVAPDLGVAQAVFGAWAGQNMLTLWVSPLVLASLYYLVPRLSGTALPSYSLALGGFWALLGFGAWTGTRSLAGGPVPVWIPSVGIAATIVLSVHYLVVAINLRGVFALLRTSLVARFLALAFACYLLFGLLDLATAFRFSAKYTLFTYVAEAKWMLLVLGVFTPAAIGTFYFALPRITGKAWASEVLLDQHLKITALGVLLLVGGLLASGYLQAGLLATKEAKFSELIEAMKPWLLCTSGGIGLILLGATYMVVSVAIQLKPECKCRSCACENEKPAA